MPRRCCGNAQLRYQRTGFLIMRVLICHPEEDAAEILKKNIWSKTPDIRFHHVRDLTAAYNVTEHHVPDRLLVAASLADQPEAELLFALAKLLGVQCFRLASDQHSMPAGTTGHDLPVFSSASDDIQTIVRGVRSRLPHPAMGTPVSDKAPPHVFCDRALILIGASTGGIDALLRILCHWSTRTPPTMIVQHTGSGHIDSLVRLLNSVTSADVRAAKHDDELMHGRVYIAAGEGTHLCLSKGRPHRAALVAAPPMSGHCPSVDMLFASAVSRASRVSAALLTGMGKDGADGLLQLRTAGAATFAQDAATSVVYGMPRIAKERGAVEHELPIDRIGPALLESTRKRTSAV